eukprot:1678884-Rhodomonas_salina.1
MSKALVATACKAFSAPDRLSFCWHTMMKCLCACSFSAVRMSIWSTSEKESSRMMEPCPAVVRAASNGVLPKAASSGWG